MADPSQRNLVSMLADAGEEAIQRLGNAPGGDSVTSFFRMFGDANGDRKVDFADLTALAQNYNTSVAGPANGDFNGDGRVDFADLVLLAQRYNTALAPPATSAPVAGAAPKLIAPPKPVAKPAPVFSTKPVAKPKVVAVARPLKRGDRVDKLAAHA